MEVDACDEVDASECSRVHQPTRQQPRQDDCH